MISKLIKLLLQHHANKEFWTWAVFFVSNDSSLYKARVQHLAAKLWRWLGKQKEPLLTIANSPQMPALSEAEIADAESFLSDVMSIFPLLGLTVFEKTVVAERSSRHEFRLRQKG
jgi:hypothetical protein